MPPLDSQHLEAQRTVVVSCDPWPLIALGLNLDDPIVVIESGSVIAQSNAVRSEVVGMTVREVESRVRGVQTFERSELEEVKSFESVLVALEDVSPWVTSSSHPGVAYFPADAAAKFYSISGEPDESRMCEVVREKVSRALSELDSDYAQSYVRSFSIGVSNGYFASWLASQAGGHIIPPSKTQDFVNQWSINSLLHLGDDPKPVEELVQMLVKLGITTVRDWVSLPAASVSGRFGTIGAHLHRVAQGKDLANLSAAEVVNNFTYEWIFVSPTADSRQVGLAAGALAEELISDLDASGSTCVRLSVMAESETTETFQRYWRYSGLKITPADVSKRVGWQFDNWINSHQGPRSPIIRVVLAADQVMAATGKQLSLLADQSYAQVKAVRRLAVRLSALVGEDNVQMASRKGGFSYAEQSELVPAVHVDLENGVEPGPDIEAPWPGSIPEPAPSKVFVEHKPIQVVDESGNDVRVSSRGELSDSPVSIVSKVSRLQVVSWAGPWLDSRAWWKEGFAPAARLQVVAKDKTSETRSYLLVLYDNQWFVEASYE